MSMMEISVLIIAIAFVALVVFLILVLLSVRSLINQLTQTMTTVDESLNQVTEESLLLIEQVNDMTKDINYKMASFNPFFEVVNQFGEKLKNKVDSKADEDSFNDESLNEDFYSSSKKKSKLSNILEWIALGCSIWSKSSKRR